MSIAFQNNRKIKKKINKMKFVNKKLKDKSIAENIKTEQIIKNLNDAMIKKSKKKNKNLVDKFKNLFKRK